MAVTTTWTSLKALIAAELKRDDLTSYIPDFINQAEFRLSREIRPAGFERYTSSAMTAGDPFLTTPSRYQGAISLHVIVSSARKAVFNRSYSWLLDYWPTQATTGVPKYYADMGDSALKVAPTPASDYSFELAYYEKLQPLDSSNETNWLTENAPDILLYASLLEAAPFLRDDARIAVWEKMLDRLVGGMTATAGAYKSDDTTSVAGG